MFKYAKLYARRDDDTSIVAFQKQLLAIIAFFLFLCGVAWWAMWYIIYDWSIPTIAAGLFGIMVAIMVYVSHRARNHKLLVHAMFLGTLIVPLVCQWSIGSLDHSGMNLAWIFLTPLGILIFASIRPAVFYMAIFVALIILTVLVEPSFYGKPMLVEEPVRKLFYIMNLVVSYSVIFGTCAWFVHTIKVEKQRSENLLLNILPSDVAEELKKFGKVEPISHEHATVLFTDFKGFTEISESITPKELVAEINHCFGAFDEITTRYNIEKIKTIGDSYMAVGGDFGEFSCTACDVVSAGMEMQAYIKNRKETRSKMGKFCFEMRVGVHTGPVISGVVGVKKFQFDIWGDTVNIASRMESHGEIGEVNVSITTRDLIEDQYEFDYRGTLPVKGKGDMPMYFVKEKSAEAVA